MREAIKRFATERRTSWWAQRFGKLLDVPTLRSDHASAVVRVLLALLYRTDGRTRQVFADGPASGRGLTLAWICERTALTWDAANEAIRTIKDLGLEYYHRDKRGHRMPSAQPRRQNNRRPDDPYVPGLPFYSEPAIRCLNTERLAEYFGVKVAMDQFRRRTAKAAHSALHFGPPERRKRKRRDLRTRIRRRRQDGPRVSTPEPVGNVLPGLAERIAARASATGQATSLWERWAPDDPARGPPPPPDEGDGGAGAG